MKTLRIIEDRSQTFAWCVAGLALLACAAGPASAQPPPAPAQAPSAHPPSDASSTPPPKSPDAYLLDEVKISEERKTEIDGWIAELASPRFDVRVRASRRLSESGASVLPHLRRAYLASRDLEVRMRIEEIARELYLDDQLYSRNAFLGISMGWPTITHAMDPRVPLGAEGIHVENVVEGTAAEEAGLRRGDIIILLDGEPVRGNRIGGDPGSFSEILRRRGVGAVVTLTVLRFEHTLEIDVTLRARPREYYDRDSPALAEQRRAVESALLRWWTDRFTAPDPPQDADARRP